MLRRVAVAFLERGSLPSASLGPTVVVIIVTSIVTGAVMVSTIYQATDLKDRRTELLDMAVRGRAVVRAVDGTALVFTRLDGVEREQRVASWALSLHAAERGDLPPRLRWLRYLDQEDRAECLAELWEALEDEHSDGTQEAFDDALHAWGATALALADPDRREVLVGTVDADEFEPVARPQ